MVTATSSVPVSYQWQRNGVAIAGATSNTYTTSALSLTDNKVQYAVVVSNAGGSVASQVVTLTVNPIAPTIDVQPASASFVDGGAAGFGVHAAGSLPMTYQWFRNGNVMVGANSSSLVLDPVTLTDSSTSFTVQVTNVAGSVTSQPAILTVAPVPARITVAPQNATVIDGANASFSVSGVGSGSLNYQWLVNGQPIAGATASSYQFTAAYAMNGQRISVVVSNLYGTDTSAAVTLTVDPMAARLATQPKDVTVQAGGSAAFQASASGTLPLSYQWQRSDDSGITWTSIPGATSTTFSLPKVALEWANASLRVVVSNPAGTIASAPVVFTVTPVVQILAGSVGGAGFNDGPATQARFGFPLSNAVVDPTGNIYLADFGNLQIRKIAVDGTVSTVAGRRNVGGSLDGAVNKATFNAPYAIALDATGNIYVGDGPLIRKISTSGTVSTIAGVPNQTGSIDGTGGGALFAQVKAMALDGSGNLVVIDAGQNQTVRTVSPAGKVVTLAGTAGRFGWADGQGAAASFTNLAAIAADKTGNFFVADGNSIRKISSTGAVALLAGSPGVQGSLDGPFLTARFNTPSALAFDGAGNLYVGETSDIRLLAIDGTTSTLAGSLGGSGADVDGAGVAAYLSSPAGLALMPDGTHFVFSERANSTVRRVSSTGVVDTLAGVGRSVASFKMSDGNGASAGFRWPTTVLADDKGGLYVVDSQTLRYMDTSGNVTTLNQRLNNCVSNQSGMALDKAGNLFVSAPTCQQIFKVTPSGVVTIVAGLHQVTGATDGPGSQATFNMPTALAFDTIGNLYVADMMNSTIRKIDPSGNVSTFAGAAAQYGITDGTGTSARFEAPAGLAFDSLGQLYVSDWAASTIRRIGPDAKVVTIAGLPNVPGLSNGSTPLLNQPSGIAFDSRGYLYIADTGNSVIRRMSPGGTVFTLIGRPGIFALLPGVDGAINSPVSVSVMPDGRVVFASEGAIASD